MPRYYFIVHAPDHTHDDRHGLRLLSHAAARDYGQRVVRELTDGGYHPSGAVLHVQDEIGQTIHSISF